MASARFSGRTSLRSRLGCCLTLALCLSNGPLESKSPMDWPHLDEVHQLLKSPDERQALRELVALGPQTAPTFWALLSGQALAKEDLQSPSANARMQASIAAWPAPSVVAALASSIQSDTPLAERLVSLRLLGWTASDAGLSAILDQLAKLDTIQLSSRWVAAALPTSLVPLLTSEPARFELIIDRLPNLNPELLRVLVEVLSDVQRPEVLRFFSKVAHLDPSFERIVLSELGQHDFLMANRSREELLALARKHLMTRETSMRRLAASALGRMRDGDSFINLVHLLDDSDAVTRREALRALQRLSNLERKWSPAQWTQWLRDEERWVDNASHLQDSLLDDDLYRAKSAARELAAHSFFAEDATQLLARCLEHTDAGIRQIGCEGLGTVKHPASVPLLISAMADREKRVQAAAHAALQLISGVDLGSDASIWNAWWRSI